MNRFTTAELADIHFVYGLANGNGRAAVRLYRERFPTRRIPNHQMFAHVHQNLCERGSFRVPMQDTGRVRPTRITDLEEGLLNAVDRTPGTSVRALAAATTASASTVWRVLHSEGLHPFHLQRVQVLQAEDYPRRVAFAQWFRQKSVSDRHFPCSVLFTDEASFTCEGVFNTHNTHMWAVDNPHGTRPGAAQHRFAVNVWAGIVADCLVGPYILPPRMNAHTYLIFLEEVLPELLTDVPAQVRRRMWFQHDGAPSHYGLSVRDHLDRTCGGRWIGRGGPVAWPPRSPDLSPIDFYLWGAMKAIVYETPVDSEMDLVARIAIAAATIRETFGIFENVRQSMQRRCQSCMHADGRNFEHLL